MDEKNENKEADISRDVGVQKCLVPGQDEWVYDYYNQQLSEKREQEFEEHLFDCDRCQDVLLMLDWVYTELRNAKAKAKAAKRRVAMKAKTNNM